MYYIGFRDNKFGSLNSNRKTTAGFIWRIFTYFQTVMFIYPLSETLSTHFLIS
uniref:Uncharacterized protein n=1 Tax=Meloidogyne enterolobii TaxID=390850 RepID=A0A6V7UTA1_MELEN|nr:unnamed protein product [Meloidogyne enterolobii]